MSNKEVSLSRLTFVYTIGNFASKIIALVLFFVYTFYLNKDSIGYLDLIITTVGWITPIISLQLSDSVLRWSLSEQNKKSQIVTGSILTLLFNSVLFLGLYILFCLFFDFRFKGLIFVFIITQAFYPVILQFARGTGKSNTYVLGGIVYSFVYTIFSLFALIILKSGLEGLLISNILSVVVAMLYISFKVDIFQYFSIDNYHLPFVKTMLKYSLPLIPNTLSWWAISTIDRYVVLFYLGAAANGLFAVGMKFPTILLMFTNIFAMAWQEKGIKSFSRVDKNEYFTSVFDKYYTILFTSILVLIAVTKAVVFLVIPNSYHDIWMFIPIIYIAVGFQALSSFYGIGYMASHNTSGALTTTIYGTLVTIALNLILVPKLALVGSSLAMLAGYFTMFMIRVFKTKTFFEIQLPLKKMIVLSFLIAIVIIIGLTDNLYVMAINSVFAIGGFVFYNRATIHDLIIKNKFTL